MDIKKEANKLIWVKHLERHFSPFVISFFAKATSPENFRRISAEGNQIRGILFQDNIVYKCPDFMFESEKIAEKELDKKDIFYYSGELEKFYKKSKGLIQKTHRLEDVEEILTTAFGFVWLTHILEDVYDKLLREETKKYIKSDIDDFILQGSKPIKKNAHSLMEEAIISGMPAVDVVRRFGWIRCRNDFSEPFSVEDIEEMRLKFKSQHGLVHAKPVDFKIPAKLKGLFAAARELVYFRTARTDVLYELFFLSRPIIKSYGDKLGIPFKELEDYTIQSLIAGKPRRYAKDISFCYLDGGFLVANGQIVDISHVQHTGEVKGMIAYRGKVAGVAKIVKNVNEIHKVKIGDILITQMTFPSFISAMHKAAAFVTDEGGITCHAAIVSREMKKPCIIGTKTATKAFKDGDMVEVDAEEGIVRKI